MTEIATDHPRWGYRMVHAALAEEGWQVNRKKVERLWRAEGLQVPPQRSKSSGQKAVGDAAGAAKNLPALYPNHVWSYDFVSDRTIDGGQLRILNVIDECTREALGSHVGRHIGAHQVTRFLAKLFDQHGRPRYIRADNGREFIADHVRDWLGDRGVTPVHIEKGKPQQNCYIERFNGTMRNELLNGETLHSVLEARVVVDEFLELYNTRRPHRGLGMKTPAAYGKMLRNAMDNDSCEGGE
jgi:putative transposase